MTATRGGAQGVDAASHAKTLFSLQGRTRHKPLLRTGAEFKNARRSLEVRGWKESRFGEK